MPERIQSRRALWEHFAAQHDIPLEVNGLPLRSFTSGDNEAIGLINAFTMADQQDSLRIHLSLVSHTNIGKTTLARTLLMRDVGEIADRAHVTETTDDYLLARGQDGSELILWDTPGFGNSVALAKRLEGRSNPLGWFLSEVWDRFTNKSFGLTRKQ